MSDRLNQDPKVGDLVKCEGQIGLILEIWPRGFISSATVLILKTGNHEICLYLDDLEFVQ